MDNICVESETQTLELQKPGKVQNFFPFDMKTQMVIDFFTLQIFKVYFLYQW